MTELLLTFGASNLLLAFGLALIAWVVHRSGKWPMVAHVLWLVVLVKLLTPPIVSIPVVTLPTATDAATTVELPTALTAAQTAALQSALVGAGHNDHWNSLSKSPTTAATTAAFSLPAWFKTHWKSIVLGIWLTGSSIVLFWTLIRVYRFQRLLDKASAAAPHHVQDIAHSVAQKLSLRSTPMVYTTTARLSPMVWWIGSRVRIIIPDAFAGTAGTEQLRWILGHELAHVRRRDYLVRWIEWLACVSFWWNPVAWWARRNLRINEEICCDALVLSALRPEPRTYANALMTVVEFLASPALRPPAVASAINSGGILEKRFNMIVSHTTINRSQKWTRAIVLACAAALLPVGMSIAQTVKHDAETILETQKNNETERSAFLDTLAELVLNSTLDERTAIEIFVATEEQSRSDAVASGRFTAENFNDVLAMKLLTTITSKRIKTAVASGEMTEAQAERGFLTMEKDIEVYVHSKSDFGVKKRANYEAYKAGKISEIELHDRLMELHRKAGIEIPKPAPDPLYARIESAAAKIKRSVEAGELTEAEAERKLVELREAMTVQNANVERKKRQQEIELLAAEIHEAIASGIITEAQGKEKLEAIRRELSRERDSHGITREHYAKIKAELTKMVEAGKISKEEATERLMNVREAMARERNDHEDGMTKRFAGALAEAGIPRENIRPVFGAIKRIAGEIKAEGDAFEVDAAIVEYLQAQNLTAEQIELVVGIARRLAHHDGEARREHVELRHREAMRFNWESSKEKIEAAVEAGTLTREEADARYVEIRKKLGERGER